MGRKLAIGKRGEKTLQGVSKPRLERLLCDWANLQFPFPMVDYTAEQLQGLHDVTDLLHKRYRPGIYFGRKVFGENEGCELVGDLWLGGLLRLAWAATDERTRSWYLFKLSDGANKNLRRRSMDSDQWLQDRLEEAKPGSEVNAPPPMNLIECAVNYFQRNAKRARRCKNAECCTPHFFAQQRNQQYCSVKCSRIADLARKRMWADKYRAWKKDQVEKSKGR
jgi:hypothetical protein